MWYISLEKIHSSLNILCWTPPCSVSLQLISLPTAPAFVLGRRRAPPAPSPQLPPSARPPTFLVTASRIFARGQVLQLPTGLSCSDILPLPQRRTLFNSFPLMTLLLLDGPLTLPLARARTCKCRGVYAAFLKHMQQEHLKMLKTPRATRQVRELHGVITPTAQRGLSVEAAGNPMLGT